MKSCPKCNRQVDDEAVFCSRCGTAIPSTNQISLADEKTRYDSALTNNTNSLASDKTTFGDSPLKIDDLIRETVFGYEIVEEIGHGGMGVVYKAIHPTIEKTVAIKFLPPAFSKSDKFVSRFQREARVMSKLDHPNIVKIQNTGEHKGLYFLIMEYVPGRTIADVLSQRGKLSWKVAVRICMHVLKALKLAHFHGLLHRDIKPGNIIVTANGTVKVADFGLVKIMGIGDDVSIDEARSRMSVSAVSDARQDGIALTIEGSPIGTFDYMSPEQYKGEHDLDERTDIYAFGMTLYKMLTGRLARGFAKPPSKIDVSIPESLDDVCFKCLENSKFDRYKSVDELLDHLEFIEDQLAPKEAKIIEQNITEVEFEQESPIQYEESSVENYIESDTIKKPVGNEQSVKTVAPEIEVEDISLEKITSEEVEDLDEAIPFKTHDIATKRSTSSFFSRNIPLFIGGIVILIAAVYAVYSFRTTSVDALYNKGRALFESSQYHEAIVELQRAEKKSGGKHPDVNKLLIRSFYELSKRATDVDVKLNWLLEAQKRGGAATDQNVRNDLREVYIKKAQQTTDPNTKGDFLESARQLASGDQIDDILMMMKQVANQTKRYRRVLELITEYYNQKQSRKLREMLIQTYFDAAKLADTVQDKIRLLKKVQSIDAENEEVLTWLALAQVELAEATKASDVAIGMLERALSYDAECLEAKSKLVEMYIAEAKKTNAAKTQQYWLDKARTVDPENKEVGESLVQVYTRQAEAMDDIEERIRLIEQTLEIRPTAHAYCLMGLAYGEMGDNLKKIGMLRKALELDPVHKESKQALAETYFTLGLQTDIPNEKIKWYDMAIMYDPENVKALHNYGMVLRSEGSIDEAIEKFEQAIAVDPNFAQSYLSLGVLYWKKKNDLEKAIKNFRYYTLIDPNSETSKKVNRYIKHLENELKLNKMIRHPSE